jgi:hypothetical protein
MRMNAEQTGNYWAQNHAKTHRKPLRWLSILAVLGVLMMSGVVVANVVLSYTDNTGLGANAASPFVFQNGGNYAAANGLGITTNTYATGTTGPTVTTTISGINGVPVEAYDITEFATAATLGANGTINTPLVVGATTYTPANVVCAYAFVSTAKPTLGTTAVSGAPAGCAATTPTLGTVSTGCGATATAAVATVNLLTGAVSGSLSSSGCVVAKGTHSGVLVLYVSYAITSSGAVTATTLNGFQVPVTLS